MDEESEESVETPPSEVGNQSVEGQQVAAEAAPNCASYSGPFDIAYDASYQGEGIDALQPLMTLSSGIAMLMQVQHDVTNEVSHGDMSIDFDAAPPLCSGENDCARCKTGDYAPRCEHTRERDHGMKETQMSARGCRSNWTRGYDWYGWCQRS